MNEFTSSEINDDMEGGFNAEIAQSYIMIQFLEQKENEKEHLRHKKIFNLIKKYCPDLPINEQILFALDLLEIKE